MDLVNMVRAVFLRAVRQLSFCRSESKLRITVIRFHVAGFWKY